MIIYTPQQYNDILFNKLPQEVRDVVLNSDTTRALWKIGEKNKLQIDKVGIMHDMAMDVMMGIIASKDFVKELQNELGIPALDAAALARDIDEEIFKPIKGTMIRMYGDGAPYRPSSSLVQFYEEEETHPSLDREAILKEIESPTPVATKVVETVVKSTALETQEQVKELKEMEEKVEGKKIEKEEKNKGVPEPSMLEKLASLKLSKTFVMPKAGGPDITQVQTHSPEPKPAEPTKPAVEKATPSAAPYTPPERKYTVDPYREPLG